MRKFAPDDVVTKEVRHITYCPPVEPNGKDFHIVKEILHLKDGTIVPHLHAIPDFKYDFYVTKKYHQNHEDKKEWEQIDKLDKFTTTRSQLDKNVAIALKRPGYTGNPRKLRDSPFLYGADMSSSAILKRMYQEKYQDKATFHSVSVFDTETDVLHGTEEIIMATLSFRDRVVTVVKESFLDGIVNPERDVKELFVKYLSEVEFQDKKAPNGVKLVNLIEERKLQWEFLIVKKEIDIVKHIFKRAHEWKPDFMTIWNMDFDIPKVLEACERAGYDPALLFSDPSVPMAYKHFKYRQGKAKKEMASGKEMSIKWTDRWHTVEAPAGFYVIDSACVYRRVRAANGEEPSYALDAILTKEKLPRKLKFKEAEGLEGLDLHKFMQKNYPLQYIIYNVFDCICVELLDEAVKDLADAMPSRCGWSDYPTYSSQPRLAVDELYFTCLENNHVIGTVSGDMTDDMDDETLDLKNWVVNLRAAFITKNGLKCVSEFPTINTSVYAHVADLDVSASYPWGEACFNISKETTKTEMIAVEGVDEVTMRMQTINFSGAATNALEFGVKLLNLPHPDQMLAAYQLSLNPNTKVSGGEL